MDVLTRRARPGDGEAMSRVFDESGRASWTNFLPAEGLAGLDIPAERWERDIAAAEVVALVAERDGEVVAFAVVRPTQDAGSNPGRTGELDTLYALPSAWGRGVGRMVMSQALDALRELGFEEATLWTAEENHRSRHLYEAAGWRLDGARRRKTFIGVEFTELRYRIGLGGQ
jgi:RimJ/RimL family protein N-acetyltransferase